MLIERARVTYASVPKCACSSLKAFAHAVDTGRPYSRKRHDGLGLHQLHPTRAFEDLRSRHRDGYLTVAVVRHPVDRILSCYFDKVRGVKLLQDVPARRFARRGIPVEPSPREFVERLDAYQKVHPQIRRHSLPLAHFLGPAPEWFDRIFDISQTGAFGALVNERAGTDIAVPSRNVNQVEKSVDDLARVVETILERFQEDLRQYGSFMRPSKWLTAAAAE